MVVCRLAVFQIIRAHRVLYRFTSAGPGMAAGQGALAAARAVAEAVRCSKGAIMCANASDIQPPKCHHQGRCDFERSTL